MPSETSSETVAAILATARKVESLRKIAREVTAMGYSASYETVRRILRKEKDRVEGVQKKPKGIPPQNTRPHRIKSIEKKVFKDIDKPNPPSQRQMAKKYKVSVGTIHNIITKVYKAECRKKYPVHALSNKQAQQRLDRGPNFLKYLKGEKWKFIVTIDEFWVYPTYVNGQRKVYYKFRGRENCEEWRKDCQQKHPKGIMYCAGISFRGPTKMFIIPSGAKINADLYIKNVLKPLIEKEIPRLYGKDAHKVVLHHDNAPAHQAKKTQEYLRQSKVRFIPKEHWMGNSPDLAPMDFAANGIFMGLLFHKKPRDDAGLERAIKTAWAKLPMDKIQKALKSWKRRVELMIERKGFQIEHLLN